MEELIARVTQAAGIDAGTAQQAVGQILAFLQKEAPPEAMQELFNKIPGAADLASMQSSDEGGGGLMGALGGMMGGGIMALAGKLTALGLGMGEMQAIGKEVFAYAREKAGEDTVGQIAGSIPGLSQFV